jgi:hypothetical protein
MPIDADKRRARFTLSGSDIAPAGVEGASPEDRRAFWRFVGVSARDEVFAMLRKSVGVDGKPLRGRVRMRRDRARGPVLIPHVNDSRYITQLRWQASPGGAVLWWRWPWGKIVSLHAQGIRGVVRDVVGLTAEALERVIRKAGKWWESRISRGRPTITASQPVVFTIKPGQLPPGVRILDRPSTVSRFGKPAPRPADSIFTPPPFPRANPVRPVLLPAMPLPPWELQRLTSTLMDAAWRKATTEAEIDKFVRAVRETQSLHDLVDVLYRLGVDQVVGEWEEALDLLKRQAMERLRGRFPGVWNRTPPAGPGAAGMVPSSPRGPRPRLRTFAKVGAALASAWALAELIRSAAGDGE